MADQVCKYFIRSFLTDTQNGYTRKTLCSSEPLKTNVMWPLPVVLGIYKVNNMDIQYAQAAVYTSDFALPSNEAKHQIPKLFD
jgi:hypothetical protein